MVGVSRSTVIIGLGLASLWGLSSYLQFLRGIYEGIAILSPPLATICTFAIVGTTLGISGIGIQKLWLKIVPSQPSPSVAPKRPARPVKMTSTQVKQQLLQTEDLLANLHNDITRRALQEKMQQISQTLQHREFHLVVFGMASAGKTSLVNALLGQGVGETAPTFGTTQQGSLYTYELNGVDGQVLLTDTPGLQTIGQIGETEAKTLATAADLLVFVVAGDLLASEYQELLSLARLGKRTILALNKTDQMLPEEIDIVLEQLRARTAQVIPSSHIITIAADPQPLKVRWIREDGSEEVEFETQLPDTQALVSQLVAILQREGEYLRLANALQQTQTLAAAAQSALRQEQEERGQHIVERMQWATAATVAVTPLPAVDLVAAAAINARMIGELHDLYNCRISLKRATQMARTMATLLLKLGGVELATQAIGSLLKAGPLGLVGIPLQAASAAYLTRVAGLSYLEWLQTGSAWQLEEMEERVRRQLQQQNQRAFLGQFLQQARQWIPTALPVSPTTELTATSSTRRAPLRSDPVAKIKVHSSPPSR